MDKPVGPKPTEQDAKDALAQATKRGWYDPRTKVFRWDRPTEKKK